MMVKIGLQFRAALEHVGSMYTCGKDFRWYLKLRCANCGEVSQTWQYITEEMTAELKGGRGHANMVEKCKMCARENYISIIETKIVPYTAGDDSKPKVIVGFECRGLEPIEFDLRSGWVVESDSSRKIFLDVDLKDKEWYDYDDEGQQSVSITDITYSFVKLKN